MQRSVLFVHDTTFFREQKEATSFYSTHLSTREISHYFGLGNRITVLGRIKTGPLVKEKLNCITHPDIGFSSVANVNHPLRFLPSILKVRKEVIRQVSAHDVIIVRMSSTLGTMAYCAAKKQGKKVIVEVVSSAYEALSKHSLKGKVVAPIFELAQRKVVRSSHYVHYVTSSYLQKKYPTKGSTLACSDVELEKPDEQTLHLRKLNWGASKENLIIGTVGALDVNYKGQADVIKAIKKAQVKNIQYLIVGSGKPDQLQQLIRSSGLEKQVKILGMLNRMEIFSFFDKLDFYFHPSYTEGLPRVVIEAMSRACPVYASNVGGLPELVDHKYLFAPGRVEEIVEVLNQLNSIDVKELAAINFSKAKLFEADKLKAKRARFYEQILSD